MPPKKKIHVPEFRTDSRKLRVSEVLNKRQKTLTVVAENITDRHNLSALLRSCDAVGILEVQLLYHSGQHIPTLSESSSASASKWIKLNHWDNIEKCFNFLKEQNYKIYTTHLGKDSVSLYELNLTEPTALVFGNECDGVSEEAVNLADGNFLIPQVGIIQSLNISVACAVSLYEAFRQRFLAGMYDSLQIPNDELEILTNEWLRK